MYKLFTFDEATELIPAVDEHVRELQAAASDMLALRATVGAMGPNSVGARNAVQEINFLLSQIHENKVELDRLGVHINNLKNGAVDFPSRLGAEVVCLTWERGQDAITHFHRLSGDTSQQPLPDHSPNPGGFRVEA